MLDRHLAIVDLETTGTDPGSARITEIGIVETLNGRAIDEWSTLVNPGVPIPAFISAMTGITDTMVARAPSFAQIAAELADRLRGRLFVAHNARFDYGFVRAELHRCGIEFHEDVLCTVRLSRRLFPEHRAHGLDAILERHGLECGQRHRALGDARVLVAFLEEIRRLHPIERVIEAVSALVKKPAPPPSVGAEVLDSVPIGPGVYQLLGVDGALLYVGKSDRMRAAVRARLDEDDGALARCVYDVQWTETAGELGAILREARLLRAQQPVHNRVTRRAHRQWSLSVRPGAGCIDVVDTTRIDVRALDRYYGLFRSARAARKGLTDLAASHGLCFRRLGLEEGAGACTARERGRCEQACPSTGRCARHDTRLDAALAPLRLAPWRYRGRIGVRELHLPTGRSEVHVFDHWCYLGTATNDAELASLCETRFDPHFEPDTYQLLRRWLGRGRGGLEIVELR